MSPEPLSRRSAIGRSFAAAAAGVAVPGLPPSITAGARETTPHGAPDFDVRTHGARGDGVVDDRDAVQAAIQACADAGGGVVWFPAGSYRVNRPLVWQQGVWLVGASRDRTVLVAGDTDLVLDGRLGSFDEFNAGMRHLTIRGEERATGLRLDNTAGLWIADSTFSGAPGPAVQLDDCQWSAFEHCRFISSGVGVRLSHPLSGPPNGNLFRGCRFEANAWRGFEAVGRAETTGIELLTLESCYFVNNGSDGQAAAVWLESVRGATIARSWFELTRGLAAVLLAGTSAHPKVVGSAFMERSGRLQIADICVRAGVQLPVIEDNYFGSTTRDFVQVDRGVVGALIARNFPGTPGRFSDSSHEAAAGESRLKVALCDWLRVANGEDTIVTALDGGTPGQRLTLVFADRRTTVRDSRRGGACHLAGGVDFVSAPHATLTLLHTGDRWVEVARSDG